VCSAEKGLDHGDGKGNLEINYSKHVYKCWSCGETLGTQGPLGRLFDKHGTKSQKKVYNLIKPEELKQQDIKKPKLKLPEGYTTFEDSNPRFIPHIEAYRYLQSRGITDEIIKKYQIGYTVTGDFAYRIIVPSFNKEGVLNYFVARSFVPKKIKYKNPTANWKLIPASPSRKPVWNKRNFSLLKKRKSSRAFRLPTMNWSTPSARARMKKILPSNACNTCEKRKPTSTLF
jgi:DNA primase